ncbi:MAG: hypothetical protein DHS20C16_03620 [Phycisphaerae bacterium]|nr:MAG: hypothetical protein DHS20C16_03620 [Phycisphaerae bacterium]
MTIIAHPPYIIQCNTRYYFQDMRITWGCAGEFTTGWIESRTYTINLPTCEEVCDAGEICTITLEARYKEIVRGRSCDECRINGGFGTKGLVARVTPNWGPWQAAGLQNPNDWSDGCEQELQDMLDGLVPEVDTFPLQAGDELFAAGCLDGIGNGCQCEFLGGSSIIEFPDHVGICYKRNALDTFTHYQVSASALCVLALHNDFDTGHTIVDAWQISGSMQMVLNLEGPPGGPAAWRQYYRCAKGEHEVQTGPVDLGLIDFSINSNEFCQKILQFYLGRNSSSTEVTVPPGPYDSTYFCANANIPHGTGFTSGSCNVEIL